jgi:hypothetical protein
MPAHPDVGVAFLVDIAVVAGYPRVADALEPPILVLSGIVDPHVAAAQHVAQLGYLQSVLGEVDDDRGFLRAELRGRGEQAVAILPGPSRDFDQQPNPGTHQFSLLRCERVRACAARLHCHVPPDRT